MLDLNALIGHWGYAAIVLVVVLGNVGLPVPEETILVLAGYLVWRGPLRLALVLAVGISSAVAGDNLGYWIGRRYGRDVLDRYGPFLVTPERLRSARDLMGRRGALAVFAARFVPGLRVLAGPLAGAGGLPFPAFFIANALGALVYVPFAVGLGYAVGYGLGDYVERLRRVIGEVEHAILLTALVSGVAYLAWRALKARRAQGNG
jgi:membrane-associated protein